MSYTLVWIPIIFFQTLFGAGNFQTEKIPFDLNGRSTLYILNESKDSVQIKIENWHLIPLKAQKLDTILAPSSLLRFDLIVQGNSYYDFFLNETKYKIFISPKSTDSISVHLNSNRPTIQFSGDLQEINTFLLRKSEKFKSPDADWMPRATATHNEKTFSRVIAINDSVTQVLQQFLDNNSAKLPEWYVSFEKERLNYLNAGSILNSQFYREEMLNLDDQIQDDFLNNIVESVEVNNQSMLGNTSYAQFLQSYISYKVRNEIAVDRTSKFSDKMLQIVNDELEGLVRDVHLTIQSCLTLDKNRQNFDEFWISQVKNKELRDFLKNRLLSNPILPKGAKLPYFYLVDGNDDYHSSNDFLGKIVLINFWATSCKPCIKEFSFENNLVEKYKNQPVEIINICMESSEDKWKNMIGKFDLRTLNLYSTGNWDEKLTKSFDIFGWPHSTLIDWRGNIVQNKCPAASQEVDKLIDQLLIDKKKTEE